MTFEGTSATCGGSKRRGEQKKRKRKRAGKHREERQRVSYKCESTENAKYPDVALQYNSLYNGWAREDERTSRRGRGGTDLAMVVAIAEREQ